jgi:hypothetical protein
MGINENKSVVEEALLQIKNLEEAINENAKGILASTMKEEISELVKESLGGYKKNLREQDAPEEPEGDEVDVDLEDETEVEPEGEEIDFSAVEKFNEPQGDEEVGDFSDLEEPMMGDNEMDYEMPPLDMTSASPEEILKVFKAMGDEDGIIVKKDDDYIHLSDNQKDVEYLISVGDEESEETEETQMAENVIYELEVEDSEYNEMFTDLEETYEEEEFEGMYMDEEEEFEGMHNMDEEWEAEEFEGMYMDEEEDEFEGMYMDEEEDEFEGMYMDEEEEQDEVVYEIDEDDLESVMEAFKAVGLGFGKPMKTFSKMEVNDKGFKDDKKQGENLKRKGPKFKYPKIKHGVTEMEEKEMDEEEYNEGMDYHEEEAETKEAARTYGKGSKRGRGLRKGITPNRNLVYGENGVQRESVKNEINVLREKNEEYKKALDFFRNKLNEVAVFNSNLAYSTRLFTEHSTTKQEKINILRRFDEVDTLKESKSLYKTIKTELDGKGSSNTIKESIERRVVKTPSNGSSTNLIESKTYENPQFLRMKDLMTKIK